MVTKWLHIKNAHTHTAKEIKVLMLTPLTCLNTSETLGNTKISSNKLCQQVSTKYELILTGVQLILCDCSIPM